MCYKLKFYLTSLLLCIMMVGCEEKEPPVIPSPTLKNGMVTEVNRFGATLSGTINYSGETTVKEFGLAYSLLSSMPLEETKRIAFSSKEPGVEQKVKLTGLTPATKYYYRLYANNGYNEIFSEQQSFDTTSDDIASFGQMILLDVTENEATVQCNFVDKGGTDIQQYGFAFRKKNSTEEEKQLKASNEDQKGVFSATITGLDHSTEYEVRAFAINAKGPGYSDPLTFVTSVPVAPQLDLTVKETTYEGMTLSAILQNEIDTNGITEVGFYWSKSKDELATGGTQVIAKLDGKTFTSSLTGLEQNTTYYVKAYAINKTIKGESEIVSATTARSVVPVLSTLTSLAVTEETIKLSGKITDFGGHEITALGYTYQTADGKSNTGEIQLSELKADGTFQFTITGLKHSTEYQIKAFATNKAGNGYSEVIKVTTAVPTAPTLKMTATADGSQKINLTATIQNSDVANGITEVGFYWSKKVEDLATGGTQVIAKLDGKTFTGSLTGLEQNTTYYVKAYAINKTIKGESEIVSATTARSAAPVLSELKLVSATEKALVVSGYITDKGGHDITGLGFIYQKPNSTDEIKNELSLDKLNSDGSFQFTIANLVPGSTYQVRAYAVNQAGTGYSAYASLATSVQNEPKVEMQVGEITATSIAVSAAVVEKGGAAATLTETGFVYSTENKTPTLLDKKIQVEGNNENYSTVLKDLKQGATYYIRAYAKNDTKTGYSEIKTVTTTRSAVPTIDKVTVGTVTDNSAIVTGKVLDNGNNNLTAIGFSYKTATGNEMQVNVNLTDLSNDNTFKATLNGLDASTDYQVRAYATNKEGTGYGEYTSFKTTDLMTPKLTLTSDSIAAEFVNLSAVIQSVGKEGSTIKEVGFCWSTTNTLPTISDSTKKAELNGMNFAGMLTDLKSTTTYYIRAYAVNESVMGYSNVITIKTLASNRPGIDDNPLPDIE